MVDLLPCSKTVLNLNCYDDQLKAGLVIVHKFGPAIRA